MPLVLACIGESVSVIRVAADPKTRKHLENLGITSGAEVTPLSFANGSMILRVHDSRIAVNDELARSIIVGSRTIKK